MNKRELLETKKAKVLSRLTKTPEGRELLARRNGEADGIRKAEVEVSKQVSWLIGKLGAYFEDFDTKSNERIAEISKGFAAEVAKMEKTLKKIADINESSEFLEDIREVKSALKAIATRKVERPVVNVEAPETKVIDQTKTVISHETKYQEEAAATLKSLGSILERIAKNTTGRQIVHIENRNLNEAIPVQLVDKRGKSIMDLNDLAGVFMNASSGGGSVQYQEGQVDTSFVGNMIMWEGPSDAATAVSSSNPLPVQIISGGGSGGGTSMVDDAAFTVGTTEFTPIGGTYRSTRDAVNDGDGGALAMTAKRGAYVTLETPDGDSAMDETLNALKVEIIDGSGNQITSFGGGTEYTQDDAAPTNPIGGMMMGVRRDSPPGPIGADGDVLAIAVDQYGRIQANFASVIQVENSSSPLEVDVMSIPTVTVQATNLDIRDLTSVSDSVAAVQSGAWSVTADTELPAAGALADSAANPTTTSVGAFTSLWDDNASTWSRQKSIRHGLNTLGTGVAAVGMMLEFDDTSPTSVTENQFAAWRGSSRREAYMQIRDAAGNERGANVTAGGALQVDGSGVTQPVSAASLPLPSGAATSAKQDTIIGYVDGIETLLTTIAGAVAGTEFQVDVLTMPTVTVTATNLDIRDLSSVSDSVSVHGDVGILDQFDLTSSNPIATAIVDGNGDQITSFGGGVQYTEGDTDSSITGTAVMWEDAGNTLAAVSVAKPLPTQLSDGTRTVSVRDTGGSDSLNVAIVDASGNQITTFGGQAYTEDAASAGGESLTLAGVVRQDTLASSTSADGDYAYMKTNSAGALWTVSPSTTVAGATAKTFDLDSGAGTDTVVSFGLAVAASGGAVAITGDATNGLDVDVTRMPGTYTEDAASAGGETVHLVGVIRQDTLASSTSADGDYTTLKSDSLGRVYTLAQITTHPALTASSPVATTAGTSSAQLVASNSSRKGLIITNYSNNWVFLAFSGGTAVLEGGVPLAPNGGSYNMTKDDFTTGQVNAIATAASSKVAVQEYT